MSGCSSTCQPKIPSSTPGAPGKNAYTFLTASFTMPTAGNFVTVTVSNAGQFGNRWAVVGQIVFVENAGHFQVEEVIGTNQLKITNIDYAGNATGGSTIASGGYVSPAGLRGIQGIAGTNGTAGTARLYEVLTEQSSVTISPSYAQLASFTIPANTFVNNGDSLIIKAFYKLTTDAPNFLQIPQRKISFNGSSITSVGFIFSTIGASVGSLISLYRSELEIIKLSSNSIIVRNAHDGGALNSGPNVFQSFLGSIDFTVTNTLSFEVLQYSPSTHTLVTLTIDKITS